MQHEPEGRLSGQRPTPRLDATGKLLRHLSENGRVTAATRRGKRPDLFQYLEVWYKRKRRHSLLEYLSPADYEEQHVSRGCRWQLNPPSANSGKPNSQLVQHHQKGRSMLRRKKGGPTTRVVYPLFPAQLVLGVVVLLTLSVNQLATAAEQGEPPAWKVAEELNLIPTPQQITLGEQRYAAEEFHIVRPADARLASTGAEEINRRIESLGGKRLPVRSHLGAGPAIILATCTSELGQRFADEVNLSPELPGEQGYVIETIMHEGRPVVLALGSDDQGTLYAAITLRRLIRPAEAGPQLQTAVVRDAPAFKRRSIGKLWVFHEPHPERYIRWLARHKINYINIRGSWIYNSTGEERKRAVQGVRQLTEIAHDYGITCKMGFMTHLQEVITDEEWEKYGGVKRRGGDRWFSWSALPVHRRKAEKIARFVKDTDLDYVSMHVVDGGGYEDPEGWSQRSERTREMYGDDHARATAKMVNIYREVLNKVHPKAEFEVVPYPYHFQFAVPNFAEKVEQFMGTMPAFWWTRRVRKLAKDPALARRMARELKNHHRKLEERLPDNVLITFREGGAAEFAGAAHLWKDHPLDIWSYLYRTRAWRGMWEPQNRLIKTWYRPNYRDMFYNAQIPYGRGAVRKLTWSAAGAEYTWNTDVPDAEASFTVAKRYYDVGVRNATEYQKKSLIPRVVHRLWGEEGEAFAGLLKNNVSFYYLDDPEEMIGRRSQERFLDPYRYYEEQVRAVQQAQEKINALIARIDAGNARGVYGNFHNEPLRYEHAMNLYWTTNMAAIKGQVQWAWRRAQGLAEQNRITEATYVLEKLLEQMPHLHEQVEKVQSRVKNDPKLQWSPEKDAYRWSGEGFRDLNLHEYEEAVQQQVHKLEMGTQQVPDTMVD